jgi:hypothetical protein
MNQDESTNQKLAAALGSTLALLQTFMDVQSWEDFEKIRDQVRPILSGQLGEMTRLARKRPASGKTGKRRVKK